MASSAFVDGVEHPSTLLDVHERPAVGEGLLNPWRLLAGDPGQGANGSFSNCARPCSLSSFFFQRLPSFIAAACS